MLAQLLETVAHWYHGVLSVNIFAAPDSLASGFVALWTRHPMSMVLVVVAVAWILIDARPAAAIAVYCALQLLSYWTLFGWAHNWSVALEAPIESVSWAYQPFPNAPVELQQWLWLMPAVPLAVLALWRVRRQAVL